MRKTITIAKLNQIKQLRSQKIPIEEIARITGLSSEKIIYITNYYRLPNIKWTPEERQFLLENYQQYNCQELAQKLKRSINSIRCQKYQLNDKIKEKN